MCSSLKWVRDTVVMRMECNACWTFLGKKYLPYSCTAVKSYKLRSSHQITWCKSYWIPAMGDLRRSPETTTCTSSVIGFCPLSTDYKYSVLESCLFTDVIEFPRGGEKKKVFSEVRQQKSQHVSQGIYNVKHWKQSVYRGTYLCFRTCLHYGLPLCYL